MAEERSTRLWKNRPPEQREFDFFRQMQKSRGGKYNLFPESELNEFASGLLGYTNKLRNWLDREVDPDVFEAMLTAGSILPIGKSKDLISAFRRLPFDKIRKAKLFKKTTPSGELTDIQRQARSELENAVSRVQGPITRSQSLPNQRNVRDFLTREYSAGQGMKGVTDRTVVPSEPLEDMKRFSFADRKKRYSRLRGQLSKDLEHGRFGKFPLETKMDPFRHPHNQPKFSDADMLTYDTLQTAEDVKALAKLKRPIIDLQRRAKSFFNAAEDFEGKRKKMFVGLGEEATLDLEVLKDKRDMIKRRLKDPPTLERPENPLLDSMTGERGPVIREQRPQRDRMKSAIGTLIMQAQRKMREKN